MLLAELQHRVRNTLAVIRSIARRTAETSTALDDCAMHVDGRIGAFARVHALVTRDPAAGIDLHQLITEELLAYKAKEGDQVRTAGPAIRLQAKAAETIGLAVHELATNALKHGALSSKNGRIQIQWHVSRESDPALIIEWKETGIRNLGIPTHQGFGTELLDHTLRYDLKADVTRAFEAEGMRCIISLPYNSRIIRNGNAMSGANGKWLADML